MIGVKQVDTAYIVYHLGDLILPQTLLNFTDFKDTLNLLFAFKHHHQHLEEIVEPAYHRQKAQATLHAYRSSSNPKRSPSPDTLFTPVKRHRRTKAIIITEEEDIIASDEESSF